MDQWENVNWSARMGKRNVVFVALNKIPVNADVTIWTDMNMQNNVMII